MADTPNHIAARIQAAALEDFADELDRLDTRPSVAGVAAMARSKASALRVDWPEPPESEQTLEHDLASLLNKYSRENNSGTPDFILADFLLNVLYHFDELMVKRAAWRGESNELPALQKLHAERPDIFGNNGDVITGDALTEKEGLAAARLIERTLQQPKRGGLKFGKKGK